MRIVAKASRSPGSLPRRVREAPPPAALHGVRYLESSALVAGVLERDTAARDAIDASAIVTSSLTVAEAQRAIRRALRTGRIDSDAQSMLLAQLGRLAAPWYVLDITRVILRRAGQPFPVEPVRTLDAIHLATIEAVAGPGGVMEVITHDARIASNAQAMGHTVVGSPCGADARPRVPLLRQRRPAAPRQEADAAAVRVGRKQLCQAVVQPLLRRDPE